MRGFTLVELAVALAILAVTLLAVCGLFQGSSEGMHYFSSVGAADIGAQRALDKLVEDMRNAPSSDISVTPFGGFDSVTLKRAWGENGTATITYTVDEDNQLVRIANIYGQGILREVLVRNVDAVLRQGVKGFSVSPIGDSSLYRLILRVNVELRTGGTDRRTFSTTVRTRT